MAGNLQVRLADAKDAEVITALINVAFRKGEGFLMDRDRIDLETVQSLMTKGEFLLGYDRDVLTGCVYLEPRGESAYLGLLSIDPERQRAGLGLFMMKAAEDHCRERGFRRIELRIINVRKELPPFYHRCGYVECATEPLTPGMTPKVPCHFVKMSKPLV